MYIKEYILCYKTFNEFSLHGFYLRVLECVVGRFSEKVVIDYKLPGNILFASVFFGIRKTLWSHTIEWIPQPLITSNPQVNQELTCWQNYEEEEGVKSGQDEYWGGNLFQSEGQRYLWEYQGGKNQKYEEGAGWMYVSQHGVTVPNNRSVK